MDYEKTLAQLLDWAVNTSNVRAVVLTRSAAAQTQHPLSDRDLELHVRDTDALAADDSWWNALGEVLAVERLRNGHDQPTRLIYCVGGKLDFTLIDVQEPRGTYDRPFTVLLDKDDDASSFTLQTLAPRIPDQGMFDECCNWASAAALMVAKAIVRDEPWSEMTRDADLKFALLRMIEWDHQLRHGSARDVRYLGTRMREWMDPGVRHRLEMCALTFGRNNREALVETFELFEELAVGVARDAGLRPFDLRRVRREVHSIVGSR